jgi:heme exporter protein C
VKVTKLLSLTHQLTSPRTFYSWAGRLLPWVWIAALLCLSYGVVGGLYLAPSDYQQGDGFRIIYVHVPSAFLSMMVYIVMAVSAAVNLIWRIKLADIVVQVSASLGATFTFLALVTGSLWGKPMWGTWWIWDARLTSELILLFLYIGIISLRNAIPDTVRAARAVNIVVLVGIVNIPIIHYSVYWWNTLHQGATLSKWAQPSIAPDMLYPLLAMMAGFILYYLSVLIMRCRSEILIRESKSQWVQELIYAKRNNRGISL